MTPRRALVTGASNGIGLELARLLAADGIDVVLTARSADKLEALAAELRESDGVDASVIVADLGMPGAAAEVVERLGNAPIDILVNNAGFPQWGPFVGSDPAEMTSMLNVNMVALTELTRSLLPPMVDRGWGRILNLSSTAAFQPGPLMAVYYATKAYVLHLSLALNEEVRGTGVHVTALCPGATATGFQARGGMEESRMVSGRTLPSAARVAEVGYAAMKAGKPMVVEGTMNRVGAFATRLGPRTLNARAARIAQDRVGRP